MIARMTLLLGGAALALAMPAAQAQDMPPALPVSAAPAPAATPAPDAATPADTTTTPAATTTANPTPPPARKRKRFRIGPEVGVYLPTDSKTRDQFGSTWLSLGIGLGNINAITTKGQTTFDLQILYEKKGDNHAFLAPVGIGYRQAFSQSGPNVPYYGVTGDLELADLRSGDYNVHSGLRAGFGGSALLGVNFGDSGYFEARYLLVSRIKSFDLSGLNLTAGYRF